MFLEYDFSYATRVTLRCKSDCNNELMLGKRFPHKKSKTGITGSNIKEEKKLWRILSTWLYLAYAHHKQLHKAIIFSYKMENGKSFSYS